MLNHTETASSSTIIPLVSALLEHPEFAEGVRMANEYFFDSYDMAPLSEEEMIEEIEMNVSRRIMARDKQLRTLPGNPPSSYLYNLGYVIGTISRGLIYA